MPEPGDRVIAVSFPFALDDSVVEKARQASMQLYKAGGELLAVGRDFVDLEEWVIEAIDAATDRGASPDDFGFPRHLRCNIAGLLVCEHADLHVVPTELLEERVEVYPEESEGQSLEVNPKEMMTPRRRDAEDAGTDAEDGAIIGGQSPGDEDVSRAPYEINAIDVARALGDGDTRLAIPRDTASIVHNSCTTHSWIALAFQEVVVLASDVPDAMPTKRILGIDGHITLMYAPAQPDDIVQRGVAACNHLVQALASKKQVGHFEGTGRLSQMSSDNYAWIDLFVHSRLHETCFKLTHELAGHIRGPRWGKQNSMLASGAGMARRSRMSGVVMAASSRESRLVHLFSQFP